MLPDSHLSECRGWALCTAGLHAVSHAWVRCRWVDEECALAVFATPDDARLALERSLASGFRLRTFAQA